MNNDDIDIQKQQLIEAINFLREQFDRAAKPYYDQLAMLESVTPHKITLTMNEAIRLGFIEENEKEKPKAT